MAGTVGDLLHATLRAAGVHATYDTGDPAADRLLAAAHGRVHGGAAAWGRWVVGDGSTVLTVGSVDGLAAAADAIVGAARGGAGVELRLDLDLGAPTDATVDVPPVDGWVDPSDAVVDALRAAERPMVLAGPGVVHDRAVPGLHALAAAGSLGVLNTWGAKGVFDWRSRHHLATAGLQARDYELGGVADSDLVVTTGIDPAEGGPVTGPAVVDVAPGSLDLLSERWSRPLQAIVVPPLRSGLAGVTQQGWAAVGGPLQPTRATRHYGVASAGGGLVAADPGVAGYWVARTFATTELGGVQVPSDPEAAGFAVACGVVARLRDPARPVLAVVDGAVDGAVDGPVAPIVERVLEAGRSLGVDVPVEVWSADGEALDPDAHLARLRVLVGRGSGVVTLATDPTQLDRMVDVAGPVTAWGGI